MEKKTHNLEQTQLNAVEIRNTYQIVLIYEKKKSEKKKTKTKRIYIGKHLLF